MSLPTTVQVQLEAFINATCVIPAVVLDGVVEEIYGHLEGEPLVERLCASLRSDAKREAMEVRTAHAFNATPSFQRAVSAPDPRPAYYSFMRIWVSAEIKGHFPSLYHKLPMSFRKGQPQ